MPQADTETKPSRMSLSEILRLMLAKGGRDYSAVTLSQNAKGGTQIDVTVRTDEDTSIEDAERKASEIYDRLRERYPHEESETTNADAALTRNAKGETQITASLKGADLQAVADELRAVYDGLRMEYPMADGFTAKPGSVALSGSKRGGKGDGDA